MKNIFTLLLPLLFFGNLGAQSVQPEGASASAKPLRAYQKFEVGGFLGLSNYEGDLAKTALFNVREGNLGGGLMLRYHLTDQWALRGNLLLGKLSGDDANYNVRKSRGFSFKSPIQEFSVQGEWEPLGKRRFRNLKNRGQFEQILSPYLFAGLGLVHFDPTTDFNEATTTSSLTEIAQDKASDFSKLGLAIPIGGGLKYDLNQNWMVGLEAGFRTPFTDYLDGVSISGNKDKRDWYVFGGLTVAYRFFGKNDRDNDGIGDSSDDCPDSPGSLVLRGCPDDIVITETEKKELAEAIYGVQFETGKSTIKAESYPNLNNIVAIMTKYPTYGLRIEGHTDDVGEAVFNKTLSESRAIACFDYLASKGISGNRMQHWGFGEERPVADNTTPEGRARNRRVEFILFVP